MTLHLYKNKTINLTSLIVRDRYLVPTETSIKRMMNSLEMRGQIAPIVVRSVTSNGYRLVAGETRFLAAKRLGWKQLRADIITVDNELEYSIIEISENYERRDLTDEQRRGMKEKLVEYQTKLLEHVEPTVGGRGKKGGVSEAARQAGVSERTARRRKKEAKPRHNTENAEVSDESQTSTPNVDDSSSAPTPATTTAKTNGKSKLAMRNVVFDLTVGECERLDTFWHKEGYAGRSPCVRAIVRERVGLA